MAKGLIETINSKPGVAIGIVAVMVTAAVGYALYDHRTVAKPVVGTAFYSMDDGKTFFSDDPKKVSGFMKEGKPSYRAYLYKREGTTPYVGYMQRYADSVRAMVVSAAEKGDVTEAMSRLNPADIQVKRPGDASWVAVNSPEGRKITAMAGATSYTPQE